jgi:glycosyltransferase involved in cell wall biosynthesis
MHLLLIHQNFPGQFRDLAPLWLAAGHQVRAIGSEQEPPHGEHWNGLIYHRYQFENRDEPSLRERSAGVALLCRQLRESGVRPDLVLAHSAWGEALQLRRIWGASMPIVVYPELWGHPQALGFGFDDALNGMSPVGDAFSRQNLLADLALAQADAAVVASRGQLESFPAPLRPQLTLLPEGVDLERIKPDRQARLSLPEHGLELAAGQPLVTLISRNLEPLRGLRQALRAWPLVREQLPQAQLLLVGKQGQGYGVEPPRGASHLMDALESIDGGGISVLNWLPHHQMLQLLQCSGCHLALSYPYTLSWSVLEAMACGVPLISNIGSPIAADLEHNRDALLVPFNDVASLAQAMVALLQEPERAQQLGDHARQTMQRSFNLAASAKTYGELFGRLIGPKKP